MKRAIRAIRASWLLDGTGGPEVAGGVVVWDQAGRIRHAGSAAAVPAAAMPAEDEVLDARGCTVLPGLIDTHVHLTFAVARGDESAEGKIGPRRAGPEVTAAQVALIRSDGEAARAIRAVAAAQAALAVGVTTLCDCGSKGGRCWRCAT